MSRIIKTNSIGKQRTQLTKAIVLAVRELARQAEPGPEARDLATFIAEALRTISEGIDESVGAWEKRGYWVKADKFRMEWAWTGDLARTMKSAALDGEWDKVAKYSAEIAQKFSKVQISEHHRLGKPWTGSFDLMRKASE